MIRLRTDWQEGGGGKWESKTKVGGNGGLTVGQEGKKLTSTRRWFVLGSKAPFCTVGKWMYIEKVKSKRYKCLSRPTHKTAEALAIRQPAEPMNQLQRQTAHYPSQTTLLTLAKQVWLCLQTLTNEHEKPSFSLGMAQPSG